MSEYGKIESISRIIKVERQGKGVLETYKVGDIVWINSSKFIVGSGNYGCTGRICSIDSVEGKTVIWLDCSTLYNRCLVKMPVDEIIDMGIAEKSVKQSMYDEGVKYL